MKKARLSFMDDLGDEESDEEAGGTATVAKRTTVLAPLKKLRQAPPPTCLFSSSSAKPEPSVGMYSKNELEELKAQQKFSAPKPIEEVCAIATATAVADENVLAGEDAERATELAERRTGSDDPKPVSQTIGADNAEQTILEAARKATSDLLRGKGSDRLYMSSMGREPRTGFVDLADASDLSWEDEVMKRGMIDSKVLSKKPLRPATGIFSSSRQLGQPDIDIRDVLHNLQTLLDKTQYSIDATNRRIDESRVQSQLDEAQRAKAREQMDDFAGRLASIRSAKPFLRDVVFMLRSKLPLIEDIRDEGNALVEEMATARLAKWQSLQENCLVLVRRAQELISIGEYAPVGALAGTAENAAEALVLERERLEGAALESNWETALSDMCAALLASIQPSFMQAVEQLQVRKREAVAEAADEVLSLSIILKEFASIRGAATADEYASAFLSLSVFQTCEAFAMLALAADWSALWTDAHETDDWLSAVAAYAAAAGGAVADSGEELVDEDILPELVLSTVVPWLVRGLGVCDLRSAFDMHRFHALCAKYLHCVCSHGTKGATYAIKFRGQVAEALLQALRGALHTICVPVCKTTPTELSAQDLSDAQQLGAWQGIGRDVMAFQLRNVQTLWKNATAFRSYLLERSHVVQLQSLLWDSLRKCQPAMSKMLKAGNSKCTGVVADLCLELVDWLQEAHAEKNAALAPAYLAIRAAVQATTAARTGDGGSGGGRSLAASEAMHSESNLAAALDLLRS